VLVRHFDFQQSQPPDTYLIVYNRMVCNITSYFPGVRVPSTLPPQTFY